MGTECIYNIDLTTNNKEIISVSSDAFNHFYIANIDNDGNECKYEKRDDTLFANFFMIKVLDDNTQEMKALIERLFSKKDIIKIKVCFTSGKYQIFDIAKKRIAKEGIVENIFEETFMDNKDLCILVSDKKIRYKENLFA